MSKAIFLSTFKKQYAQREFNPQETLQWLKAPVNVFWCWGVSKMVNLENKGLLLSVNGMKHKGFVLITLAWNDTYTVRYFNTKYNETLEINEDVYCDVLQDIIDSKIEQ
jgi:hypothetical protein